MPRNGRMLCALVVGHKQSSAGAVNHDSGTTEFAFNDDLARIIEGKARDVAIQRVYRRTYRSLPDDLNELAPDFIISLHCNAHNRRIAGSEVLYYHRSEQGRQMAEILSVRLADALNNRNRGIKPRSAEERGGYLLRYSDAPCVIAEPFFIDNNDEYANARRRRRYLVDAYLDAIDEIGRRLAPPATVIPLVRQAAELARSVSEADPAASDQDAAPTGVTASEAWNTSIAHQVSVDYWARTYPEGYVGVLANPQVKELSFFNSDVSPAVRRNEMRIVVGGFLAFHAALGNGPQPDGISEDEAFNLLVTQFTLGECRLSLSGDAADAHYAFPDETSP